MKPIMINEREYTQPWDYGIIEQVHITKSTRQNSGEKTYHESESYTYFAENQRNWDLLEAPDIRQLAKLLFEPVSKVYTAFITKAFVNKTWKIMREVKGI